MCCYVKIKVWHILVMLHKSAIRKNTALRLQICQSIVSKVTHTWQSSLDKGHSVRLLLVDFSKAFDQVNHNILFQKLLDCNVPQCLLRWLFSYLSLRQQRTHANRKTSNWQYLNGSMPQGSLLGPLAFLVQIDDLTPGCLT